MIKKNRSFLFATIILGTMMFFGSMLIKNAETVFLVSISLGVLIAITLMIVGLITSYYSSKGN